MPRTRINSAPIRRLRYRLAIIASVSLATFLGSKAAQAAGKVAQVADNDRQKPYALIFGTVWDPDGHPLYGVKVKIRQVSDSAGNSDNDNEKKNKTAHWELYSNHTGEFAQRVPAGKADYIISADVKGYKLTSGKKLKPGAEITVHINNDERSDIGLHLDW